MEKRGVKTTIRTVHDVYYRTSRLVWQCQYTDNGAVHATGGCYLDEDIKDPHGVVRERAKKHYDEHHSQPTEIVERPNGDEHMTFMRGYRARIADATYIIGWRKHNHWMMRLHGPFKNETEAKEFGRLNYPYRYKVLGLQTSPADLWSRRLNE